MTMNTRLPQGDYFVSANKSNSNTSSMMVRRIRTPHEFDVLCGRGGGINGHKGNGVFRTWVADRRLDYNLASSKADKARVAKEVMNLVTKQNPPGRFLQRDPTGGIGSWWIEIDETKAMAKTSQALREGAPTIRAQHKGELKHRRSGHNSEQTHKRERDDETRSPSSPMASPSQTTITPTLVPSPLMSNAQFETNYLPSTSKRMRLDNNVVSNAVTPTLEPTMDDSSEIPSLYLEQPSIIAASPTSNYPLPSLDLPKEDIYIQNQVAWSMDGRLDEFVNPFENEEEKLEQFFSSSPEACVDCGTMVQHGKICNCMSQFDPLNNMSTEILCI